MMKPQARLVYGPANSGKTERGLRAYLDCLREDPKAEAVFLAPTAVKVAEVKERIVASGRVLGIREPRILDFYSLAQRIIAAASQKAREISPASKLLIIEEIVRAQIEGGRLKHFLPISGFQGFFEMVGGFISELKMAAVTPETFGAALRPSSGGRDAEIAAIYGDYQEHLRRQEIYDREGRLWLARDLLGAGRREFVRERLDLLVVDGFAGFSPAELQIVEELGKRSVETIITLTFIKGKGAGRHYRAVEGTYELLRGTFDLVEEAITATAERDQPLPAPLRAIAEGLFSDLGRAASTRAHPHVELIPAPGQLREVEEIAREVKRLLAGDAQAGARRLDDILVIFRSLSEYGDRVEEVFRQFGIPVLVKRDRRLCESPVVKALLLAVEAAGEGERDTVLGFLKSSYVTLGDEVRPDQIALAAFRAGIISGLDTWEERLRRYRNRQEAEMGTPSPEGEGAREGPAAQDIAELQRVSGTVSAIIKDLRTIPARATAAEFLKVVEALIERFRMEERLWVGERPEWTRRDVAALEQLRKELRAASALLGDKQMTRAQFCELFREICQTPILLRPEAREGKVLVMEAQDAGQMHSPVVFVGGLAEKEFPRYQSEDALCDDERRRQLRERGVVLSPRALRAADEMLLFYSAVTRATEKLYLAYPLTDSEGKEKIRSYFVDELLALFADKPSDSPRPVCGAAPPLSGVFSERDAVNAAAYWLWQREPKPSDDGPALYNHLIGKSALAMKRLVSAVAVEEDRESKAPFGRYDGVLDDPAIRERLAQERRKGGVYSTSRFNEYGVCPFRYFCNYVLKLEPLEEPEEETGAQELGLICHNILYGFYSRLRDERKGATELARHDAAELQERMEAAAREEFAEALRVGRVRDDALWRIQQEIVLRRLRAFVVNEIEWSQKDAGRRPAHFEVSFGSDARGRDPASTGRPLVIDDPSGAAIRVRGRIDRVDVVYSTGKGQTPFSERPENGVSPWPERPENGVSPLGLIVIDYKYGRYVPNKADMEAGLDFQLPVYIMAAENVLFPKLTPVQAFFYKIRDCTRRTVIVCADDWEPLRAAAKEKMREYVAEMSAGRFPVEPRDECLGARCPYCTICRYSEARHERKRGDASVTRDA